MMAVACEIKLAVNVKASPRTIIGPRYRLQVWDVNCGLVQVQGAASKKAAREEASLQAAWVLAMGEPVFRKDVSGSTWVLYAIAGEWVIRLPSGCTTLFGRRPRQSAIDLFESQIAEYENAMGAAPPSDTPGPRERGGVA